MRYALPPFAKGKVMLLLGVLVAAALIYGAYLGATQAQSQGTSAVRGAIGGGLKGLALMAATIGLLYVVFSGVGFILAAAAPTASLTVGTAATGLAIGEGAL